MKNANRPPEAAEDQRLDPVIEAQCRETRGKADRLIGMIVRIGNGTDAVIRLLGTIASQTVRLAGSMLGEAAGMAGEVVEAAKTTAAKFKQASRRSRESGMSPHEQSA